MPNLQCPRCHQVESHLGTPRERGIDGYPVCEQCRALEREPQGETVPLFTPAPAPIAGQLGLI